MTRRVFSLASYFAQSLLFSLSGLLYILLALVCWWVLFDPRHTTPHMDYYILMLSALGAAFTFLIALTMAAHANRAIHASWLVRLPRRIEYLFAVLISGLIYGTLLQLLVALLAIYNGPRFTLNAVTQMPLVWLPINLLAALMGLLASDFCADDWSRVYLYGGLLICFYGQKMGDTTLAWLPADVARLMGQVLGFVFWPFTAQASAVRAGAISLLQMMSVLILALYAALAFMLAVRLFDAKDLQLTE